jgi:heme-degrading monooxygenase HmoA
LRPDGSVTHNRNLGVPEGSLRLSAPRVLRLFQFRPVRSAFDGILRDTMLPDLRRLPGLIDLHLGRRGPDELGQRLLATVWSSQEAMVAAVGEDFDHPVFHPEFLAETTDRTLESRPLAISMALEVSGRARILRTLRGQIRPGERDAYIEQARLGYLGDVDAGRGPLAIHLGTGPGEDDFVTLSVWDSWSAIEAATGGDVRRPMATRHPELIIAWEATHLEIIEE